MPSKGELTQLKGVKENCFGLQRPFPPRCSPKWYVISALSLHIFILFRPLILPFSTCFNQQGAPPKPEDVPVVDASTIDKADGFVFGFPTRFGMMASQMKAFFDATGQHWSKGSLHGKAASMFTSAASQNGGQGKMNPSPPLLFFKLPRSFFKFSPFSPQRQQFLLL